MHNVCRGLIFGALAFGCALAATPVLAQADSAPNFQVINSSNDTLKVDCSVHGNSVDPVAAGTTADFTCTGTVLVQIVGGNPQHYFSFDCQTGQVHTTTVTAAVSDLNLAHECVAPAAGG